MRSAVVFTLVGMGTSVAAVAPTHIVERQLVNALGTITTFTLQAYGPGSARGPIGQLGNGANRIGGGLPLGEYTMRGDRIWDKYGRGCILTPPTTVFQCDPGVPGTPGFAITTDGTLTINGTPVFWACPANDYGVYDLHSKAEFGQPKCVQVSLKTEPTEPESEFTIKSFDEDAPPEDPAPESSPVPTPSPSKKPCPHGSDHPKKCHKCKSKHKSKPCPHGGDNKKCHKCKSKQVLQSLSQSVYTSETGYPESLLTTTSALSEESPLLPYYRQLETAGPIVSRSAHIDESATSLRAASSGVHVSSVALSFISSVASPFASTLEPTTFTSIPLSSAPDTTVFASPSFSHTPSFGTFTPHSSFFNFSSTSNIQSPPTSLPSSSFQTSASPIFNRKPAASPSATRTLKPSTKCPADLKGPHESPRLMVPVDVSRPNTAFGPSQNGTFTPTTCTIYNFDIDISYKGRTCSTMFLLPTLSPSSLDSSYTYFANSNDGLTPSMSLYELRASAVGAHTRWGSIHEFKKMGEGKLVPGNSVRFTEGRCRAGERMVYLLCLADGELSYVQEDAEVPVGLYIRGC